MIFFFGRQTTATNTRIRTPTTTSVLLLLLLLSSSPELSDAWGCSRCSRLGESASFDEQCEGGVQTIHNCEECLVEGREYCDYCLGVNLYFAPELPYYDFCLWRLENQKDLTEMNNLLDCEDWYQYDEDRGTNYIETINSQPLWLREQLRCYRCDQRCTRVYNCGNTTYACNHLFDIAMIQFNLYQSDLRCRSIVPLDPPDHQFEYCDSDGFEDDITIDCGGLCDLYDEVGIPNHICPNGQSIDSYWTVCGDDQPELARMIGYGPDTCYPRWMHPTMPEVCLEIEENTNMEEFYKFSCVDLGEVTCEQSMEIGIMVQFWFDCYFPGLDFTGTDDKVTAYFHDYNGDTLGSQELVGDITCSSSEYNFFEMQFSSPVHYVRLVIEGSDSLLIASAWLEVNGNIEETWGDDDESTGWCLSRDYDDVDRLEWTGNSYWERCEYQICFYPYGVSGGPTCEESAELLLHQRFGFDCHVPEERNLDTDDIVIVSSYASDGTMIDTLYQSINIDCTPNSQNYIDILSERRINSIEMMIETRDSSGDDGDSLFIRRAYLLVEGLEVATWDDDEDRGWCLSTDLDDVDALDSVDNSFWAECAVMICFKPNNVVVPDACYYT